MAFTSSSAMALAEEILTEFVEAAEPRTEPKMKRRWWWKPDGASKSGCTAMYESHALVHPTPRHWCAVCNPRGGHKPQAASTLQLLLPFADAAE